MRVYEVILMKVEVRRVELRVSWGVVMFRLEGWFLVVLVRVFFWCGYFDC
jgi:hypothetical protein